MEIKNNPEKTISNNANCTYSHPNAQKNPSFGAAGSVIIDILGGTTQGIQNSGFLGSFLIQDGLGMTAPRVGAAFLRDKEVTGQYNVQEGFEVLGREGLTGPCMMAVAPIVFAIAAIFGKTTGTNSRLIKRVGNSLKEFLSKTNFNKELLKDKKAFKEEFWKENIRKILSDSLGKENVNENSVTYILEQLKAYENVPEKLEIKGLFKKKKYKNSCLNKINEHINDLRYNTSEKLEELSKVKFATSIDSAKNFDTHEAFEALIKYTEDIVNKGDLENLSVETAEKFKNTTLAKRLLTNIATVLSTIGVLSVLPKIYAKSNVSPSANTESMIKKNKGNNQNETTDKNEVTFKGKGDKSLMEKLGELLSKIKKEDFASEFEYNGFNFTNTLMACLTFVGMMPARIKRANDRAKVDENGKKDRTEIHEILVRDLSSAFAVIFAVPLITRAFVSSYEKKSGFVLLEKDRNMSGFKTFIDLINPYSKTHVLTNKEIEILYNSVNNKEKMLNFCKYIDNNGGNLYKILSKSDDVAKELEKHSFKLADMSKLDRKEANKKILEFFSDIEHNINSEKADADKFIEKLMKNTEKISKNKIFSFARGLNSVPFIITTFLISPYILGWCIPRLTYANTRRHLKNKESEENKLNAKV